jgi:5-methyltetrahydrofolate--homocysteine methyltransferase
MSAKPFSIIGELINHSFARARRGWEKRDLAAYQNLARLQSERGASYLTVNIDGTQALAVTLQEMLDFLPQLVPALQAATSTPLAFDNPSADYHRVALAHYDKAKSGRPILNSIAASRHNLDEMIALVKQHDTLAVVMASEKRVGNSSVQCMTADDVYQSARELIHLLRDKADRRNADIIIDPGLAPISADTYGLVNSGLDAMRMIRADDDLRGVHISVGITNLTFGLPREIRAGIENAYITLAIEAGLDFVLGNPEKDLHVLAPADPYLKTVKTALEAGRPVNGESQEEAGYRQSETLMELFQ